MYDAIHWRIHGGISPTMPHPVCPWGLPQPAKNLAYMADGHWTIYSTHHANAGLLNLLSPDVFS